jgi:hypothetical protein
MDVIIVSKTHMHSAACIGGVLANGKFVRLLDEYGHNQDVNTSMNVGDVYTIFFNEREDKRPPHIEDILVLKMKFKFSFSPVEKMIEYLREKLKVKIWEGGTEVVFDGKIKWTQSGSGYISESCETPENSVGFWISDKPLTRRDYQGKVKYSYPPINSVDKGFIVERQWRSLPFVGFQSPVDTIPAGTLVRLSLARWWSPEDSDVEERCYLQLSGWYGLPEPEIADNSDDEDLPF